MDGLILIGVPASTYVRVCRIALAEKGVTYELVPARPHSPDVTAINPLGKVPVMRHGSVTLSESSAIARYIDQVFPGPALFPTDPVGNAYTEQWVSRVNSSLDLVLVRQYLIPYIFPGGPDGAPDRSKIDPVIPAVTKALELVQTGVAATGHLVGDQFTFADMNLIPILEYLQMTPEAGSFIAQSQPIQSYLKRHAARESVASTVAKRAA